MFLGEIKEKKKEKLKLNLKLNFFLISLIWFYLFIFQGTKILKILNNFYYFFSVIFKFRNFYILRIHCSICVMSENLEF